MVFDFTLFIKMNMEESKCPFSLKKEKKKGLAHVVAKRTFKKCSCEVKNLKYIITIGIVR